MKKHQTSYKYWLKYHDMAVYCGVSLKNSVMREFQKDYLEERYAEDRALNTIPLEFFDRMWVFLRQLDQGPKSLAENTCLFKHVMLYEVLELVPEFIKE